MTAPGGLARQRDALERPTVERTRTLRRSVAHAARLRDQLEQAEAEMVASLAPAIAARSCETYAHLERVGRLAAALCAALGEPPARCDAIGTAARLHDIGKVAIPNAILLKEGPLDAREREHLERHAEIGHLVLLGSGKLLELAAVIALGHHERFDGRGYPLGLAGEEIPLAARICAVADVFDALTGDRPYRPAFDAETAMAIIAEERGGAFDPRLVDAFGELSAQASRRRVDAAIDR